MSLEQQIPFEYPLNEQASDTVTKFHEQLKLPGIDKIISTTVIIEPIEPIKLKFAGKCGDIARHLAGINHIEYLKRAENQPAWVINTMWELHNSLYEREFTITDAEIYAEAFRVADRMRT